MDLLIEFGSLIVFLLLATTALWAFLVYAVLRIGLHYTPRQAVNSKMLRFFGIVFCVVVASFFWRTALDERAQGEMTSIGFAAWLVLPSLWCALGIYWMLQKLDHPEEGGAS